MPATLTIATAPAPVFFWSTPADAGVAPWRCSDRDALIELAALLTGQDASEFWAEGNGRDLVTLEIGIRDNRDEVRHEADLIGLHAALCCAGLQVRKVKRQGFVRKLVVTDRMPRGARLAA